MKPVLLILIKLARSRLMRLAETFEVIDAPDPQSRAAALAHDGARVQMVLTNGSVGLSGAEIDRLPALSPV
jgi:hypothetical protein